MIWIVFISIKNLYISLIMSSFEFNKILAAIILAIIVIVIISKVGDIIVDNNKTDLQETAYKIDIPESDSNITSDSITTLRNIEPIIDLLASASLENGEKIYKKCGSCHNYKKDSKSKIGPNLWDIINRPKANSQGFAYSEALAKIGGTWTYEELNNFLYKPKEYIKGTKMNFVGLKNTQDRADIILFLRQQSDNLIPLP